MITSSSQLFVLAIRVIGLTAIAVILFSTNVPLGTAQLQEQNHQVSVSIAYGSASRGNFAFQQNHVHVSVGDTIMWTNDDRVPHTVTSGQNAIPDGQFDSGRMVLASTFEHTFTKAGEYPYYCSLHPNMVGTVSVG
jgi:plastocyanin